MKLAWDETLARRVMKIAEATAINKDECVSGYTLSYETTSRLWGCDQCLLSEVVNNLVVSGYLWANVSNPCEAILFGTTQAWADRDAMLPNP